MNTQQAFRQYSSKNTVDVFLCKSMVYNSGIIHGLTLLNIAGCNWHSLLLIIIIIFFLTIFVFKNYFKEQGMRIFSLQV